ncbi:hypothetical protein HZU75_06455 [Chitinibacter fontanus]|uniref:Uncharacterized protein n=1 Tax=Chitinibacter fontanus TaxID=1737446 RepID=A0A7D5V9U7_9NEIS|nr:hypothetical protein [Chitinibacter fontanus]QLI81200.1 hypothetical protein HZU75_06455 [Chitinibacter fontanus]
MNRRIKILLIFLCLLSGGFFVESLYLNGVLFKYLRFRYFVYKPIYALVVSCWMFRTDLWWKSIWKFVLGGIGLGYIASFLGFIFGVVLYPPTLIPWIAEDPIHRVVQLLFWPYFIFGVLESFLSAVFFVIIAKIFIHGRQH